MAQQELLQQP